MPQPYYVLDLCSGLGGFSEAFLKRGWTVRRIDNDPKYAGVPCTEIADVLDKALDLGKPDVIVASPPCQAFSLLNVSKNWIWGHPMGAKTKLGLRIMRAVLYYIDRLKPCYWFIENPRAMMRTRPEMQRLPRVTITQCQYGAKIQKPTDIWTNALDGGGWHPKPACKRGASCHVSAPRGSSTGLQGSHAVWNPKPPCKASNACHLHSRTESGWGTRSMDAVVHSQRSLIPYRLSEEICLACERALSGGSEGP